MASCDEPQHCHTHGNDDERWHTAEQHFGQLDHAGRHRLCCSLWDSGLVRQGDNGRKPGRIAHGTCDVPLPGQIFR